MKLTKSKLKQIIQEEVEAALKETYTPPEFQRHGGLAKGLPGVARQARGLTRHHAEVESYSIPNVPELEGEVWDDLEAALRVADQYSPPPDVVDNRTGHPVGYPGPRY